MGLEKHKTSALPTLTVERAVANLSWTSYRDLTSASYPYLRMTQKSRPSEENFNTFFFNQCVTLWPKLTRWSPNYFFQLVGSLIRFSFQLCVSFPALPGSSDPDLQPAVGNSQALVYKLLSGWSPLCHQSQGRGCTVICKQTKGRAAWRTRDELSWLRLKTTTDLGSSHGSATSTSTNRKSSLSNLLIKKVYRN